MLQIDFLEEIIKECKANGIHTAVDTAGHVPFEFFERILPYTDLFLYDFKCYDSEKHKKYTGVSNVVIKRNLERLVSEKVKLEVRCLSVPGCTDGEDLVNRHKYLKSLGIADSAVVDLEYYDYARSKYLALGMPDTMPPKLPK
jgi:pyruvate formate lyase activating enzyme